MARQDLGAHDRWVALGLARPKGSVAVRRATRRRVDEALHAGQSLSAYERRIADHITGTDGLVTVVRTASCREEQTVDARRDLRAGEARVTLDTSCLGAKHAPTLVTGAGVAAIRPGEDVAWLADDPVFSFAARPTGRAALTARPSVPSASGRAAGRGEAEHQHANERSFEKHIELQARVSRVSVRRTRDL